MLLLSNAYVCHQTMQLQVPQNRITEWMGMNGHFCTYFHTVIYDASNYRRYWLSCQYSDHWSSCTYRATTGLLLHGILYSLHLALVMLKSSDLNLLLHELRGVLTSTGRILDKDLNCKRITWRTFIPHIKLVMNAWEGNTKLMVRGSAWL